MRNKISSQVMVLTGAGFTKNFGGYLVDQMYSAFFNELQCERNKELLMQRDETCNYETVYSEIIYGDDYTEIEKSDAASAMEKAYKELDEILCSRSQEGQLYYDIANFVRRLLGNGKEVGYFFTLNQDLFVERHLNVVVNVDIVPMGVGKFDLNPFDVQLEREKFKKLEYNENNVKQILHDYKAHSNEINYVKLHGSYGWLSYGGSNAMVVGAQKEELINKEPLLKEYFQIFKDQIQNKNRRLLIIGYGFRDEHINKILQDGLDNHGLKLYVIDVVRPRMPKNLKYEQIWQFDLINIFPSNTSQPIRERIERIILSHD